MGSPGQVFIRSRRHRRVLSILCCVWLATSVACAPEGGDGSPDAVWVDGAPPDAQGDVPPPDAELPDAAPPDAAPRDAAPLDAAPLDAAPLDAAPPDTEPPDAAPPDAEPPDLGPPAACGNGLDDDGDGRVDLDDPGCAQADDDEEADGRPACGDGIDNDDDGAIDRLDPDCYALADDDESGDVPGARPACANGRDDDRDGRVDFPDDPECRAAGDAAEASLCPGFESVAIGDEVIEIGRGFHVLRGTIEAAERSRVSGSCMGPTGDRLYALVVDTPSTLDFAPNQGPGRPGYHLRSSCMRGDTELGCMASPPDRVRFERLEPGTYFLFIESPDRERLEYEVWLRLTPSPPPECADGIDNDEDGHIDAADRGCTGPEDEDEAPDLLAAECGDGRDNDGDGRVDHPDDPGCAAAGAPFEEVRCVGRAMVEVGQAGGRFAIEGDGFSRADGTCGRRENPEVGFALTLDEPSMVIAWSNRFDVDLYARAACDAPETEVGCGQQTLVLDRLEPGVWFVFAEFTEPQLNQAITFDVFPTDRACNDGLDNDGDGLIDALDPGCARAGDDDERDPDPPAPCANGLDDDGDGAADHPEDPECAFAGGESEGLECDGRFEVFHLGPEGGRVEMMPDLRGEIRGSRCDLRRHLRESVIALSLDAPSDVILTPSAGWSGAFSLVSRCADDVSSAACGQGAQTFEGLPAGRWYVFVHPVWPPTGTIDVRVRPAGGACLDGRDNDGDGRVDLDDPGCDDPFDRDERDPPTPPPCGNGLDDDGDGLTDFPDDPDCAARGAGSERAHCASGLPVVEVGPGGGRFELPAREGVSLDDARCAPAARETVLALTLDETSRVGVRVVTPDADVALSRRAACDAPDRDFCARGRSLEIDALPPGTHYIFVSPAEPGALTVDVFVEPTVADCADERDNDGDGVIDAADPGCVDFRDDDEGDPPAPPACADGLDNDGDGHADWPEDVDCHGAGGAVEATRCAAGMPVIEVGPEGGVFELPPRLGRRSTTLAVALTTPSRVRAEVVESNTPVRLSAHVECDQMQGRFLASGPSRIVVGEVPPGVVFVRVVPLEPAAVTLRVTVDSLAGACFDGVDNDGDGWVDAADVGCRHRFDDDEADPADGPPACSDGLDNDGDGRTDWPEDPDCRAAGAPVEAPRCALDLPVVEVGPDGGEFVLPRVPGVGIAEGTCGGYGSKETVLAITLDVLSHVDVSVRGGASELFARSACDAPESELGCRGRGELALREVPAGTFYVFVNPSVGAPLTVRVDVDALVTPCTDGEDNDGDGLVDFSDPGCVDRADDDEADPVVPPACADGVDDDGDGAVDYPDDFGCQTAGDEDEGVGCGPAEVAAVLDDAGGVVQIDTIGAPEVPRVWCLPGGAGVQVIAIRLSAAAAVTVSARAADFPVLLDVRTTCDEDAELLACTDDEPDLRAGLELPRLEPGTYYVVVTGAFLFAEGRATISVQVAPL